ncbi:MAG: hypothetical protein AABY16_00415 [Nanoarchaeota archaeon]
MTDIAVIGNNPLSFYVTLTNLGNLPSGISNTQLSSPYPPGFPSSGGVPPPEIRNVVTPIISPSQYVTLGPVTFTANVPTGTAFTMAGTADSNNQVVEGSESNNILLMSVSV